MDRWIRNLAKQIGAAALAITVLGGMVLRLDPLELILRGIAVGLIFYFAIVLVGGLLAQALLRMALEEKMAREEAQAARRRARKGESEDGSEEEDEEEEQEAEAGAA